MTQNLLVLYPDTLQQVEDESALIERLQAIGFIGDALDIGAERHYRPGEKYLFLMTFMGCSPVVSMGEPGKTGDEFCHIAFERRERPSFLAGNNVKIPRCPACGHRDNAWQEHIAAWEEDPEGYQWQCPDCAKEAPFTALRWRKCAGFGSYFIKVWGVFESEAIPSDKVMQELEDVTGVKWRYFYLQSKDE